MGGLRPALCAAVAAALATVGADSARAQAGGQDRTPAARWTAEPIALDGGLTESAWRRADSVTEFTQLDPDEGAPASERTVVRFLATGEALYVGVEAYDSLPALLSRAQLRRDADLGSDDAFTILLDPQRDRRSGYLFSVNPNGAMYDAEIQGPDDTNDDWDGRWDARALVLPWGWSAEIRLPWQTLRYPRSEGPWGLNLERYIHRNNELVLWRAWQRHQGLLFQEAQGALGGLDSLPERPRAEIRPYVVMAQSQAERDYAPNGGSSVLQDRRREARVGGDLKLGLGPTLTLDLTANSDFAQVEVDERVVNLTRFPLRFPEKRPFFLENSGIFDMGESGEVELFYSRRIGLADDGQFRPLHAGGRLHGRTGQYRVGVLATRSGAGSTENATDVVARVSRDLLSRGRVGAMLTSRHEDGASGRWSVGLDGQLPLLLEEQNLVFSGYGAATSDDEGGASAWGLSLDYPNDWTDSYVGISRVGNGFDPALGFVREDGVRRYVGGLQFFPRPPGLGVRRLDLKLLEWEVAERLEGGQAWATYEIRPFGVELDGGSAMELNLQRYVDVPDEAFEVFPGSRVPAGSYRFDRVEARYLSAAHRTWVLDVAASVGEFYDGTSREFETSLELRAAPHLIGYLDYALQSVRRPGPDFTARVVRAGIDVAASPRLGASALVQWENESDRMGVNLRVHWTPQPGTDFYLAWTSVWPTGLGDGIPWRRPEHGMLVGKVVHYLRW
jgi:Domain of unknown function (DUF5916)